MSKFHAKAMRECHNSNDRLQRKKKRTPATVPRLHQSALSVSCVTDSLIFFFFPENVNNQRRKHGSKVPLPITSE